MHSRGKIKSATNVHNMILVWVFGNLKDASSYTHKGHNMKLETT